MIYIVTIFIIVLMYYIIKFSKIKHKEKVFLKITFIILFLLLALRNEYHFYDIQNYIRGFNLIKEMPLKDAFEVINAEPIYIILVKLISFFSFNERIFLGITSLLSLIGPYLFIKRNSKNYLMSVIMYIGFGFYILTFYAIRQAIALSLLLYITKFLTNKNYIKFTVGVIIATLIHNSSIIFIFNIFLTKIKMSNIINYFYIVIAFIVLFMSENINNFIITFFYSEYINYESKSSGINLFILISSLLIFCIFLKNVNKYDFKNNSIENISINNIYFSGILQILAINNGIIARLINNSYIFIILIFPYVITNNKKNKNIVNILATTIILVVTIYLLYSYPLELQYLIMNI